MYLTFERWKFHKNHQNYVNYHDYDNIESYFVFFILIFLTINPFIRTVNNIITGNKNPNFNFRYVVVENYTFHYLRYVEINGFLVFLIFLLTSIPTTTLTLAILQTAI